MVNFGVVWILSVGLIKATSGGTVPSAPSPADEEWEVITLWPGGIIPYDLPEDMYSKTDRGMILSAMKRWQAKTCIKFVPWTDELQHEFGEVRYIKFFSTGSCFSKQGRKKYQPQLIGIGSGCRQIQVVVHELGHAIGLIHEMERNDRDFYIDVNYDAMNPDSSGNYDTTDMKKVVFPLYRTPYDYKSIMHYGPKAWTASGGVVITTKDPAYQNIIGKAQDLSFFDALFVNRAYNCTDKCSSSLVGLCRNGGFLGGPDCRCICQDGYVGQFCDQPLPGYEKIIDWKCQKGWTFHAGKCYNFKTDESREYFSASSFCTVRNATLVTFKTRPEVEWLNRMTAEKKSMSLKTSFWVGIWKNPVETDIHWTDGTLVDTNVISLIDNSLPGKITCAKFDGESITLGNCSLDEETGFICGKLFDPSCGGRYIVTETATVIQSPGFPKAYPEDIDCQYVLQTDTNSRINITFNMFLLEANCKNDFLEINFGDVTKDGQKYCGNELRGKSLLSDENIAILTFKTTNRLTSMGFKMTVKLEDANNNGDITTPSPFAFLDALRNTFDKAEEKGGITTDKNQKAAAWSLSSLMDLVKSMAFSKVL